MKTGYGVEAMSENPSSSMLVLKAGSQDHQQQLLEPVSPFLAPPQTYRIRCSGGGSQAPGILGSSGAKNPCFCPG